MDRRIFYILAALSLLFVPVFAELNVGLNPKNCSGFVGCFEWTTGIEDVTISSFITRWLIPLGLWIVAIIIGARTMPIIKEFAKEEPKLVFIGAFLLSLGIVTNPIWGRTTGFAIDAFGVVAGLGIVWVTLAALTSVTSKAFTGHFIPGITSFGIPFNIKNKNKLIKAHEDESAHLAAAVNEVTRDITSWLTGSMPNPIKIAVNTKLKTIATLGLEVLKWSREIRLAEAHGSAPTDAQSKRDGAANSLVAIVKSLESSPGMGVPAVLTYDRASEINRVVANMKAIESSITSSNVAIASRKAYSSTGTSTA